MQSYNRYLGFENSLNNNKENKIENNNECSKHQHTLYQYLVSILKSIDETLKNPKTSEGTTSKEGMVTKEELASALSKIVPGISEDELAEILKNYSTLNEIELKLVNYVLKSELPDTTGFATKEEVNQKLDKTEASQTYASQGWVTEKINQAAIGGDGQDVDLSAYALNTTLDTKVENLKNELTTNIETRLTETQANEKYAKKDEIPDTTGLATKEEVNSSINDLNSKITDLTNTTKEELINKVQLLTEKNTLLENKLTDITSKLENFMNNFAINPNSTNESVIWTKSEYDALKKKDDTKIYLIKNS